MDKKELQTLLDQYDQGTATPRQIALLEQWFNHTGNTLDDPEGAVDYEFTGELIWSRLSDQVSAKEQKKTRKLWFRISAAAAAVLILVSLTMIFVRDNSTGVKNGAESLAAKSILPGHYGATITLADQSVVVLDSTRTGVVVGRQLVYDDGTALQSGTEISSDLNQTLIASTARGQTYSLTLSDGSKVWLNADSKIEFPGSFGDAGERTVKLTGEGYFEISKDPARPFVVETSSHGLRKGQFVKVLGTHFNINSYGNEPLIKTTLLEGSVAISQTGEKGKARILVPGEQSKVGGEKMEVVKVDMESVASWKNNKFIFDYEELPEVLRKIERWYDVKVVYDGDAPDEKIWGTVTRYQDLSVLLKFLESTGKVKFRVEGRTVFVSK